MMDRERILELIWEKCPQTKVETDIPLAGLTTFHIGGPAELVLSPRSWEDLKALLNIFSLYDVPFIILGRGSNLLVDDAGYRGAVIRLGDNLQGAWIQGNILVAESGIPLSALAKKAASAGLSGLEFASGIPGTLGGAIYMNAGAYEACMSDVVQEVVAMDRTGLRLHLDRSELEFGYRRSIFQSKSWIILQAVLQLTESTEELIVERMKELNARRREKQPLELPSAGSVFKRPEGHFAGALIEEAGLKGLRIGDAMVSEKHAGFIVNVGFASSKDVLALIREVAAKVEEKSGVVLEPEIRYLTPTGMETISCLSPRK